MSPIFLKQLLFKFMAYNLLICMVFIIKLYKFCIFYLWIFRTFCVILKHSGTELRLSVNKGGCKKKITLIFKSTEYLREDITEFFGLYFLLFLFIYLVFFWGGGLMSIIILAIILFFNLFPRNYSHVNFNHSKKIFFWTLVINGHLSL